MILLIRDNECFEPRVNNYIRYFTENRIPYRVVGWDRGGTGKTAENSIFFRRRAEYGKRIANIPNKLAWMAFVVGQIIKAGKDCTVIHACDIDAAIPALFAGRLLGKKVVFDIFDWISPLHGRSLVYTMVEWMQNLAYRCADHVILCEKERTEQAKRSRRQVLVLPNLPTWDVEPDRTTLDALEKDRTGFETVISYVGVFDRDRGLENLLECVSRRPEIKLNIAGFGVLEELVSSYAREYPNIMFWGRVEYGIGQTIMKGSDLIAAMYHLSSPLHRYAAPNKYYESLKLGVPVITTEGTLIASKVAEHDTGFIIGEREEDLAALLLSKNLRKEMQKKRDQCEKTWKLVYASYFDSFMANEYCRGILGGS